MGWVGLDRWKWTHVQLCSKPKVQGGCSSRHLHGAGAYCGSTTTGRTAYYYSESLGYAVLPLEGRITAWCRPAPCLSVPFWPISPEEKVVKTSDLRFTDTPFWGKKVEVTSWTGWIFESTQHWFTSLYATYPRKRASALPDSCAYVIRQAQLFMRLIHIRISPQNFLFCLH